MLPIHPEPACSSAERPRRMLIPRSRRLTMDVLYFRDKVPTCAHDRHCDFSRAAEIRSRCPVRIAWPILFIKAFALVAARYPVLRQTYQRWPWPHVYQHPHSVAALATHRDFRGEEWLFWSRIHSPETRPLIKLQRLLNRYQTAPVEEVFRRQFQLSALPGPLRRMLWTWTLAKGGPARANRVGTFFLTTIAAEGAEIQHPPAFFTANATYGPFDERERSRVTVAYDHRLMDGRLVASVLRDLESALNGPVAAELASIRTTSRGAEFLKRTA